jgi:hypothetical protein
MLDPFFCGQWCGQGIDGVGMGLLGFLIVSQWIIPENSLRLAQVSLFAQ